MHRSAAHKYWSLINNPFQDTGDWIYVPKLYKYRFLYIFVHIHFEITLAVDNVNKWT